jgi:hypothetical protein
MKRQTTTLAAMGIAAIVGSPALGGYTITQGSSANIYTGFSLNFDEPGGPTGPVATTAWLGSHGLTIDAGDGAPQVDNWDIAHAAGWGLGDNNSFFGNFGVFMTFDSDLDALSLELWDPSGPPSPFGGGLSVFLFNDGVEVSSASVEPAWGGFGDSWFDIMASGGDVFDEIRILGFGFEPTTYADNLSWNTAIPAPGSLALLALAGVVGRRRNRK